MVIYESNYENKITKIIVQNFEKLLYTLLWHIVYDFFARTVFSADDY